MSALLGGWLAEDEEGWVGGQPKEGGVERPGVAALFRSAVPFLSPLPHEGTSLGPVVSAC